MEWNEQEVLVCVFADATVHTFSAAGEKIYSFSLGAAIKAEGGIIKALLVVDSSSSSSSSIIISLDS
ncbi:hypothetical protein, conserved [Eimeria acervulina]|uniref:Vps16 N-terminal domain-containing protein n=1 Tax=Eimeria acervulina TaxID=5801 RepID=U6GCM8_EIMAC|nr:hypothetical protein, conserved [Eimeria acervulina]CDI77302.1 hypothetical protein, conserved [Eimeria acervulina]